MSLQTETAREEYECLKAVQSEEMHAQLKKIDTAEMVRLCVSVSCALKFMLYILICITLCGRVKGKAGIHLKCYPENRDTFEMYPGKVMHMIGG